jgi:1-acylglycerone phosphate reductase
MLMVQAFISLLIPARGLIINISSASTEIPYLFSGVYSATKGALNTYSRVLRMELEPFNVRVMVSMTGTVRSNFASRPERTLSSDSLYQPVEDMYIKRLGFSQKTDTMPTETFAVGLVNAALKGEGWFGRWIGGTPDWYWGGGMTKLVWLGTLMPRWLSEKLTAMFFEMSTMVRRIQEAGQKKRV